MNKGKIRNYKNWNANECLNALISDLENAPRDYIKERFKSGEYSHCEKTIEQALEDLELYKKALDVASWHNKQLDKDTPYEEVIKEDLEIARKELNK